MFCTLCFTKTDSTQKSAFECWSFSIPQNINKSLQQGMTLICEKQRWYRLFFNNFFFHQLPKHTTFMMPKNNKRDLWFSLFSPNIFLTIEAEDIWFLSVAPSYAPPNDKNVNFLQIFQPIASQLWNFNCRPVL